MGLSIRAGRPNGPLPSDPLPQWSYAGFSLFRRGIASHIGINLSQMHGYGGGRRWSNVTSPLRHLLDHDDDRGELTPEQARELAPALSEALAELGRSDPEGLLWGPDGYNGRVGREFVDLLTLCVEEDVPVVFC
ncbi:MAG TPA: hypothetical protein VN520_03455 [Streptomyces sp.]|uniref:hypothetical protein n=1 Tax=Streptomyces sp. TaxID=1931 RepID=UPI002C4AB0AF|nr:hypothetical protein [Streptomyces sp.]HWU05453.1 hypothetical protein [Streptomyces sp.]